MGAVVDLASRKSDPHLAKKARCCVCRHEWVAVAPLGTDWLECPDCHLMKGRYLHPKVPCDGFEMLSCACGCDVFRVTEKWAFCIHCGTERAL